MSRNHQLLARAEKIKLLILDVDGVLSNGYIIIDDQGNELKQFHVQDGLGIVLLQETGVQLAIISGRKSDLVAHRMQQLGITKVYQGCDNKIIPYEKLLQEHQLTDEQVAYVGDDLIDIPLLKRVGLAITVPNSQSLVKKYAHYETIKNGGDGAVREICELIMEAQNTLTSIYERYTHE